MTAIRIHLVLIVFLISLSLGSTSAFAVRLVKVRVFLDDNAILEGSFSVTGHETADQCWEKFLRATEERKSWSAFRETDDFDSTRLLTDKSEIERSLLKVNPEEKLVVSIGYAGRAEVKQLSLRRYTDLRPSKRLPPRKWTLDVEQLKSLTSKRKISDREKARMNKN